MSIGTITSDGSVNVQFVGGKKLGAVEESFVSQAPSRRCLHLRRPKPRIRPHPRHDRPRPRRQIKKGAVPRWMGGRLPMSSSLAEAVRLRLEEASDGIFIDDEMRHVQPILELAGPLVAHPAPTRNPHRIHHDARRTSQLHLLFPGPARARRTRGAAWPFDFIAAASRRSPRRSTITASSCSVPRQWRWTNPPGANSHARTFGRRRTRLRKQRRVGQAPFPRDRAHRRPARSRPAPVRRAACGSFRPPARSSTMSSSNSIRKISCSTRPAAKCSNDNSNSPDCGPRLSASSASRS